MRLYIYISKPDRMSGLYTTWKYICRVNKEIFQAYNPVIYIRRFRNKPELEIIHFRTNTYSAPSGATWYNMGWWLRPLYGSTGVVLWWIFSTNIRPYITDLFLYHCTQRLIISCVLLFQYGCGIFPKNIPANRHFYNFCHIWKQWYMHYVTFMQNIFSLCYFESIYFIVSFDNLKGFVDLYIHFYFLY